jgi:hypothetical protein
MRVRKPSVTNVSRGRAETVCSGGTPIAQYRAHRRAPPTTAIHAANATPAPIT